MKERPLLFSAPMVRAVQNGSKTQTRRLVKTQPDEYAVMRGDQCLLVHDTSPGMHNSELISCPYGQPGERLWVKENYRFTNDLDRYSATQVAQLCLDAGYKAPWAPIHFEADGQRKNWEHTSMPPHEGVPVAGKLRPNIFMPRWASRIDLEITSVRVERLQDCSEADAKGEGADCLITANCTAEERTLLDLPLMENANPYRNGYALLWESINGPGSWDANPWVWVIEFRRIKP